MENTKRLTVRFVGGKAYGVSVPMEIYGKLKKKKPFMYSFNFFMIDIIATYLYGPDNTDFLQLEEDMVADMKNKKMSAQKYLSMAIEYYFKDKK